MHPRRIWLVVTIGALLAPLAPASAQIKPASSGALSYNAPQMRRHGSGFHRPNRAHHHHHHHHVYGVFR